jgi:hypothetical protein
VIEWEAAVCVGLCTAAMAKEGTRCEAMEQCIGEAKKYDPLKGC